MIEPVKLFLGFLYSTNGPIEEAIQAIDLEIGKIDYRSSAFPFDQTDFYKEEMGEGLQRIFVSIERWIHPGELIGVKKTVGLIEDRFRVNGKRTVNIDPGYLDFTKVVLASHKTGGQKLYIQDDVFIDLVLYYHKNRYEPLPWSFPDFKSGIYDGVWNEIRSIYKKERRTRPVTSILPPLKGERR